MRATLVMWGALGVLHRDALKPPAGVKVVATVLKLNFLSQKILTEAKTAEGFDPNLISG